jgi:hypothetical protein
VSLLLGLTPFLPHQSIPQIFFADQAVLNKDFPDFFMFPFDILRDRENERGPPA